MKSTFAKSIVVLAAALVAGASFAADSTGLTRDQVRAEYLQARADGTMAPTNLGQSAMIKPSVSTLTREAVQADYFAARKAGTLHSANEAQPVTMPVATAGLSREAVRAEYFSARKAGTLPSTHEGA